MLLTSDDTHQPDPVPILGDDLPIALRKGVRSCIQHPIHKYVSYQALSPSYKGFVANLENVAILRDISEAMENLEWKRVVLEEMDALEKNGTWEIVSRPDGLN